MEIKVNPDELFRMWQRANRASNDLSNIYAQGVYDTLQWLTGNQNAQTLIDEMEDSL